VAKPAVSVSHVLQVHASPRSRLPVGCLSVIGRNRSWWVEVTDRIEERILFLGESFEFVDEPAFAQAPMMRELPDHESGKTLSIRKPFLADGRHSIVIRDEDSVRAGGIGEEDRVQGPFRKDIDRPLNVPPSRDEPVDELLTYVIIGKEWEPRH